MDTMTRDYLSVQKLIHHTVNKFQKRYGGDTEEMVSEANLAFTKSHNRYDTSKGSLTNWTHVCVWRALIDYAHKQNYERKFHSGNGFDLNTLTTKREDRLSSIMEGLSPQARRVAELVLNGPTKHPNRIRKQLKSFLKELGWCSTMIWESFAEIRTALSEN